MFVCTMGSYVQTFLWGMLAGAITLAVVFVIYCCVEAHAENKRAERRKKNPFETPPFGN